MQRALFLLSFAILAGNAAAQHYLLPEAGWKKHDAYHVALREVFHRIYNKEVVSFVLVVPSFEPEKAAGVMQTTTGYKAFCVTPSASVWETKNNRAESEAPTIHLDSRGNELWREKPDPEAWRKRGLPDSYHDISTRFQTRVLPVDVAETLNQVWQKRVSEAFHPPPGKNADRVVITDGVSYYYSTRLPGRGLVTTEGKPAEKNTLVWRLGDLAEAVSDYAQGKASLARLEKMLRPVE